MNTMLIIVVLIFLVLLAFYIIVPQWRARRAVYQVIRIFRWHGAIDVKHAKTIDELGLTPRTMLAGLMKGRDYKVDALKALIQVGIIVQGAESGQLYLSEERLAETSLGKATSQYR
jgi:hypothetical protein